MSTCTREMDFFPANFMLQNHHHHQEEQDHFPHIQNPTSLVIGSSTNMLPPQDFHGTIGSFLGKSSMSYSRVDQQLHEESNVNGDHVDDLSDPDDDDGLGATGSGGSKKRRLNIMQLKTLEKSFELGNKLEPERKLELSRALGLQPRQIAIWFQNRRARWKTKQLEKDYDLLKSQFDALKVENDSLQSRNKELHAQILALKYREPTDSINLNKVTEGSSSNRSTENSYEIKRDLSRRTSPAIDSYPQKITSIPFFPPNNNSNFIRLQQLAALHLSKPSDHHHHHQPVKEEDFCNMFDDQTAFWPWLEQQPFN